MCLNCGCNALDDDMGNPDNLTLADLAKATRASEMNARETLANLRQALDQIDPRVLDEKVKELG